MNNFTSEEIPSSQLHMSRQGYMCPPNHLPYDSGWFKVVHPTAGPGILSAEVLENFIASAFCPLRNLDQLGGALWPKGFRRSHSDRGTLFFFGKGG